MNYFIGFILKRKTTINKSIDFFNYLTLPYKKYSDFFLFIKFMYKIRDFYVHIKNFFVLINQQINFIILKYKI